jgi:hypothetical protein
VVFESNTRLKQPFANALIPQQKLDQVIVDGDIEINDEGSNF